MIEPGTWALVSDCVRARILRGLERGIGDPEPPTELVERPRGSRIRAALAGAPEEDDRPDEDIAQFAGALAQFLDIHRIAADFARLAVFAEPRMLAALRDAAPEALWSTVVLEEPRNLVVLPETALRAAVLDALQSHQPIGERP
jgi:protein required for attachment to host cells